jgi:multidrug efflux pump subunit AcrA (membrane-fusion protein)
MSKQDTTLIEAAKVIVPFLILAAGAAGFVKLKEQEKVEKAPEKEREAPIVDTVPVAIHDGQLSIRTDGQVVPYLEVVLSAEVGGRVVEKLDICRAGRFVRKGDLLLKVDRRDYELEKRRLQEELVQADVQMRELAVEVENTQALIALALDDVNLQQNELDRQLQLLARRANSAANVDEARRGLLQAKNSELLLKNQMNLLSTRRDRLASAKSLIQVQLEKAELDLARTNITSPVDGVVVTESVEEDSFVQKGTRLVTIEDTSSVEVLCNLRMDELYWILDQQTSEDRKKLGEQSRGYHLPITPVTVSYRVYDAEYRWSGTLWRYDGIGLDERTRTVPCRILVSDPQKVESRSLTAAAHPETGPAALVRGMYVTLQIHATPNTKLLQVPELAVQPGNRVLRVRNDRLRAVEIKVVATENEMAIVRAQPSELDANDQVVVSTLAETVDDMIVQPRRQGDETIAAVETTIETEEQP